MGIYFSKFISIVFVVEISPTRRNVIWKVEGAIVAAKDKGMKPSRCEVFPAVLRCLPVSHP